ncbi:uncharacterized protein LOC131008186 [Salvia miltiorrhiza]|uniref:uncharacterized protein LOC131008186 n=1 Tax=Salvia miltiorrhiza TaxID=226208 RepID=UPI0025AB674A|nr:uncharacterized protein LOC131008186 [Salvia miltiorrhiza]
MKRLFLEHFFPPTKTNALKNEISGANQEYDESLSAYWTRFRRLVDSCPNHKFTEGDLLQYFYQGMTVDTKNLVNSASGEGFSQNTVSEAKRLIQHLVEATREYEEPHIQQLKKAAQASSSDFEEKFEARMGKLERILSTMVEKVAMAGQPPEKPCGACGNVQQLQQSHADQKVQIEGLARQVSQLATSVNQLKGHQGKLPSQVQVNPQETVNLITLRSGKELDEPPIKKVEKAREGESGESNCLPKQNDSEELVLTGGQSGNTSRLPKQDGESEAVQKGREAERESVEDDSTKEEPILSLRDPKFVPPVPFPRRLARKKPEEEINDFMKIFGKLEINLPFLQALKLPHLSKFLKDFIDEKSKKSGKILVATKLVIQLADGSRVHPEGLLENVLVKVHDFVYPADFYVVKMSGMQSKESPVFC